MKGKGMTTCKICGRDFALIVEEHYIAEDPQKVGAIFNLVNSDKEHQFDAFDCPYCGCQNIMQERKPYFSINGMNYEECEEAEECNECDECEKAEESENPSLDEKLVHDGCAGCVNIADSPSKFPCKECKQNYVDLWRKEK